jgi:hypothetical protein
MIPSAGPGAGPGDIDAVARDHLPWLVCMEAQCLHFAPEQGELAASLYAKVEACRRLLAHARASRWRVVHVHRRRRDTPPGKFDPELRPIDGLQPLPTERVYIRDAARSLTLKDDLCWQHALAEGPARFLMVGHISARGMVELVSSAPQLGVELAIVEDAVWRWSPESAFGEQSLPLSTLKRLQSMQQQALLARTVLDGRYSAANAR